MNDISGIKNGRRICLLDLNYTLVANQLETKMLRPFSRRMEAEEYRTELIEAIKEGYVIIVTARPDKQKVESLMNIAKKTGWQPDEAYFNDIDAYPHIYKESALRRFIFPKYSDDGNKYYAVESNPRTRAMYARYGIEALPFEKFIKNPLKICVPKLPEPLLINEPEMVQMSLF